MSTLEELNQYADNVIQFTDNRPSNVIFSYPDAADITDEITTTLFSLQRNIDIIEIVQPTLTNIIFTVDVSAISGASVTFSTLPIGVTSTNPLPGIFKVQGIDSVSDWDAIKTPSISIPSGTQGSFEYTCTIEYTNDGVRKSKSWTVGKFKPVAALQATSSMSITPTVEFGLYQQELVSQFVLDAQGIFVILGRFSVDVSGNKLRFGEANLESVTTLSDYNQFSGFSNLTYQSNVENTPFSGVSYIDTRTADVHRLDFTVSNGYITNSDDPSGTLTNTTFMTDTNPATITSFIQGMKIYPDYNYSGDIVVRVQTYYGGAIQDDFKTTISNSGVGTLSSRTATFNSSGTFTASVDEILYGRFYTTVVGGGGGGTYGGGGGGGGGINFYANLTSRSNYLDNRDYSIVVGTGGAANNNTPTNGTQAKGGTGGTSSAFGAVANGGEGGSFQYNFSGSGYYSYDLSGGDSGTATYLITTIPAGLGFDGSESVATSFTTTFGYGGGGGGSNGGDAPGQNIGINNDGKRGDSGGTKGGYGEGRLNTSSIPPGFAVSPNSGNGGNYGAFVNQTDIYATNGADGRVVIEITPK